MTMWMKNWKSEDEECEETTMRQWCGRKKEWMAGEITDEEKASRIYIMKKTYDSETESRKQYGDWRSYYVIVILKRMKREEDQTGKK